MGKAIKNGKVQRIEQMKEMLRHGFDRKDILEELLKTYKVSNATMDNELKEAREFIRVEMEVKEQLRQAQLSEQLKSEINASIKTDLELDLILSQIATGNIEIEVWLAGEASTRGVAPMEQIAAIDKLYKRRGSYAATKVAQTNTAGDDAKTELSDTQLEKLLHAITKPG